LGGNFGCIQEVKRLAIGMVQQKKYVKIFLKETAEQLGLSSKYHTAFVSRFDPSNENRASRELSKSSGLGASDVTYLDHVGVCLKAFETIGGPEVIKTKGGRPLRGQEAWKKTYRWFWDEYYPNWLNIYESKSKERILANLLLELNFRKQIDKLEEIIRLQPISTFCIDVHSLSQPVEKWTFKTLSKKVPGLADKPFIVFKQTPVYPSSVDWFWEELRRYLGEDLSKEGLLDRIVEICAKESVLIILTAVNNLQPELEQELFRDFFVRLAQHSKASALPFGRRIVILMIREHCDHIFSGAVLAKDLQSDAQIETNLCPIILEPLTTILGKEVNLWLMQQQKILEPLMGQNYGRFAQEAKVWDKTEAMDKSPLRILEKICRISGLDKGVAEVENYWRIESVS
jgi:inactive STAND